MTVRARPIDPRDVTSEVDEPSYRVYFWDPDRACREYELSGGDVDDAIAWANSNRTEQETYTLHVALEVDDGVLLVRLAGAEPADIEGWASEASAATHTWPPP